MIMATKLQTREIRLPHPGFYNSIYSSEIDSEESQWVEYQHERGTEGGEMEYPAPLRINEPDLAELLMQHTTYSAAYRALAESYVETFSYAAGEALDISAPEMVKHYSWADRKWIKQKQNVESLRLTFAAMESPKYYNFETDRVFANIPCSVINKLWAISKADEHATLSLVAKDRHSSRSGFISHYESDWRDWGPVAQWDINQLETLLIAACEIREFDCEDSDLSIYYATVENTSHGAWSNAVDWPAFDVARLEKRAELLADWLADHEEKAKAWIGHNAATAAAIMAADPGLFSELSMADIPYRCPETPDMFANVESAQCN